MCSISNDTWRDIVEEGTREQNYCRRDEDRYNGVKDSLVDIARHMND